MLWQYATWKREYSNWSLKKRAREACYCALRAGYAADNYHAAPSFLQPRATR